VIITGRRVVAALLTMVAFLAACGGGSDPKDDAADAKAYATKVAAISTANGDRLGALSDQADYRKGDAAARSTRAYADAIRNAAGELRRAQPPAAVATLHASLVKLYAQTADALDALAVRFEAARDPVELAQHAQDLSTAVQRYSTQEQELRASIERAIAGATAPPTS
jgi:hypothetical protein